MALKSKQNNRGSDTPVPPFAFDTALRDANALLVKLHSYHHWSGTVNNRDEDRRSYYITITHKGRRVSAERVSFVEAANAAIAKMETPTMRLVGSSSARPVKGLRRTQ